MESTGGKVARSRLSNVSRKIVDQRHAVKNLFLIVHVTKHTDSLKQPGQAGTQNEEIEVTTQMVEAGFAVLRESWIADEYLEAEKCTVADIYRAMFVVRPNRF